MTHGKNKEHIHVKGLIEVCYLPTYRDTPKERKALSLALGGLTQVAKDDDTKTPRFDVVRQTLFVELALGDVSETALPGISRLVLHRVAQKARHALHSVKLVSVS